MTSQADPRSLNPALLKYLKAIYELEEEGTALIQVNIAARLGVSAPTVSESIKKLAGADALTIDESHHIAFTKSGRSMAEALVRRHRLAERILTDFLGIAWHACHQLAEDWEKVMTVEVEQAVLAKLPKNPTCPHGNPIPGTSSSVPWSKLKSISELKEGESATVSRLLEDIQLDHDALVFLEENELLPGRDIKLKKRVAGEVLLLEVSGREIAIGEKLAALVWTLPA